MKFQVVLLRKRPEVRGGAYNLTPDDLAKAVRGRRLIVTTKELYGNTYMEYELLAIIALDKSLAIERQQACATREAEATRSQGGWYHRRTATRP